MTQAENLEQALGICFADRSLLKQALVHTSLLNENPDLKLASNERLEFLGDTVLGFIITQTLYREFPELSEGELTKIRASLSCRDILAHLSRALKLGDYLYLGKGEELSGGRKKQSNLANALEAVIAAIFLDQGLEAVSNFIHKLLDPEIQKIRQRGIAPNYKALLQEYTQAACQETPTYRVIEATGPAHRRRFKVEVTLKDRVLGTGHGKSKRVAETEAARFAWEEIKAA